MPAETHSRRDLSAEEATDVVVEVVAELIGVGPSRIAPETPLPRDALARVDLVDALTDELAERAIGLDDDTSTWSTVADVLEAVLGTPGVSDD